MKFFLLFIILHHFAILPAFIKPSHSIDSLDVALLPKKVPSLITTPPFITADVEIWQLSSILESCSIKDFVLIIQFSPTVTLVFVLAGVYYGLGGFIEAVRAPSSGPATAVGFELDAISAAVIGGVSFVGGTGKIRGVVIGVFLLQIIFTGLIFLGIAPYWTYVVKGAIILFAVALDMRKYMVKK